jgi:DNA-binding XRE family transcriptional regulator
VKYGKPIIDATILHIRQKEYLFQKVLTGFAKLARSHLNMIETGDKNPNFETPRRIATTSGMSPHELIKFIEGETALRFVN